MISKKYQPRLKKNQPKPNKYQKKLKTFQKKLKTFQKKLEIYPTILKFFALPVVLLFVAIYFAPCIFRSLDYSIVGNKTITYSQSVDYTIQALLWSMGILLASKISDIKK